MIKITDMRVASFVLDFMDISWEANLGYEDPADYAFFLEKGDSAHGEFRPLHSLPIVNKFRVRDNTRRGAGSHERSEFYRLRIVHQPTGAQSYYPEDGSGVSAGVRPSLHALEIARQEQLALQEVKGRKVWLFSRRRFGARCSCYDEVMKKKVRSNCLSCYDTSFIGGYESPVEVWGQVVDHTTHIKARNTGNTDMADSVFNFGNYPELFPGDVIVELENKRWRVGEKILKVEQHRFVVRQQATLLSVSEGDIEFALPVKVDPMVEVGTPVHEFVNPRNLDIAKVEENALGNFARFLL